MKLKDLEKFVTPTYLKSVLEEMERGAETAGVQLPHGIRGLLLEGTAPGGFIRYLFHNDLYGAAAVADTYNSANLAKLAVIVHSALPVVEDGRSADFYELLLNRARSNS
jgi:hypothetical protein